MSQWRWRESADFVGAAESWGDRMEHILRLTVYTLLAAGGKTFADIERMLIEPEFRDQVVASITNLRLLQFWKRQFPALPKNALDPITNKFSKFINPLDTTGLPAAEFAFLAVRLYSGLHRLPVTPEQVARERLGAAIHRRVGDDLRLGRLVETLEAPSDYPPDPKGLLRAR